MTRQLSLIGFLLATSLNTTLPAQSGRGLLPSAVRADGLTLRLAVSATVRTDAAEFVVRFENDGDKTRILSLGLDRFNQLWPQAITLLVSEDGGAVEAWPIQDGRVAGRLGLLAGNANL